jgi:hypothetical protein
VEALPDALADCVVPDVVAAAVALLFDEEFACSRGLPFGASP